MNGGLIATIAFWLGLAASALAFAFTLPAVSIDARDRASSCGRAPRRA